MLHYSAQLSLGEFAAFHLRDVIFNLDILAVARTTKFLPHSEKIRAEDELSREEAEKEAVLNSLPEMQEQVGGSGDEAEDEEEETSVERTIAVHSFETEELRSMLCRVHEVAEGKKKGRKIHRLADEALW